MDSILFIKTKSNKIANELTERTLLLRQTENISKRIKNLSFAFNCQLKLFDFLECAIFLPAYLKMTTALTSVETQHDDMIHDCQFDYYARKLATCSSDRTIRIFDVIGDVYHPVSTITGHEGPVWQLGWAHPKFGVLLASCSYDGAVLIHREAPQNVWTLIYTHKFHESSVNSISWAPHEYGLILACASSDGKISLVEYKGDQW